VILLISEPADEAARLHPNERFSAQASDDRPDIQMMYFGESPRPESVVRVISGTVVLHAPRNGGQIRRFLAQSNISVVSLEYEQRPIQTVAREAGMHV
jgi:hypothetical protein